MIAAAFLLAATEVAARLRAEPPRAGIGEPVQLVLEVDHAPGVVVRLPAKGLALDASWVLLDEPRIVRTPSHTRATWRALSLESGERALPALALEVEEKGAKRTVEAAAGALSVLPALEHGEDAPRPMKGFRGAPADAPAAPPWTWIGAAALALSLAGGIAWRRLRRRAAPAFPPTPLARLADLERSVAAEPEAAREVTYGVSGLLRESIDAFLREPRAALTDAAWVARIETDERVPLDVRSSSARLLRGAERIKYALVVPSPLALKEILADARGALEALASAPPLASAAPGASPPVADRVRREAAA